MLLELNPIFAIQLIIYGFLFFIFIASLMGLYKILQNSWEAFYQYELGRSVDAIHLFIENTDDDLLKQIKKNPRVRDYIVNLTDKIAGPERDNIRLLYHKLRYYQKDLKKLKNPYYKTRLFALVRLSRLREHISRKTIEKMLDDPFHIIRWQAMEYLIHTEQRKSLSNLLYFTHRYFSKEFIGVIYHLLGLYAQFDREGIVFLIKHTQDEELILALLKVMEEYPHPSAEDAIWDIVKMKSHPELIISALKILGHIPNERYFSLLELMHAHEFWVVRMVVAKRLALYSSKESFTLLERLIHDPNHLVRTNASHSMISINTHESNRFIGQLLKDESHPTYHIIKNQMNIYSFYGE